MPALLKVATPWLPRAPLICTTSPPCAWTQPWLAPVAGWVSAAAHPNALADGGVDEVGAGVREGLQALGDGRADVGLQLGHSQRRLHVSRAAPQQQQQLQQAWGQPRTGR